MSSTHLQEAIKALRIADIRPQSLKVSVRDDFDNSSDAAELVVQWRHDLKRISFVKMDDAGENGDGAQKLVLFTIETGLRYVTDSDADPEAVEESAIGAEIMADFRATYVASEELDKDCLEEFGNANALYHVWPYWRELIQSTCARFGLPPMVLPMYQVPISNRAEDLGGDVSKQGKVAGRPPE